MPVSTEHVPLDEPRIIINDVYIAVSSSKVVGQPTSMLKLQRIKQDNGLLVPFLNLSYSVGRTRDYLSNRLSPQFARIGSYRSAHSLAEDKRALEKLDRRVKGCKRFHALESDAKAPRDHCEGSLTTAARGRVSQI